MWRSWGTRALCSEAGPNNHPQAGGLHSSRQGVVCPPCLRGNPRHGEKIMRKIFAFNPSTYTVGKACLVSEALEYGLEGRSLHYGTANTVCNTRAVQGFPRDLLGMAAFMRVWIEGLNNS